MSRGFEDSLEMINTILVAIFTVDIILKLAAYGVKQYFLGGSWNIFDFVVLVGSFVDIMVSNWYTVSNSSFILQRLSLVFYSAFSNKFVGVIPYFARKFCVLKE